MPEVLESDDFCRVEAPSEDWFTSPGVMPSPKKYFRRMHEQMWEEPQAAANVFVFETKRALDKRFLEQGRIARTAAIWAVKSAHAPAPLVFDQLVSEIHEVARESLVMGFVPANEDTQQMAIKFAKLLPTSITAPEIGVDPDGEISFDWLGASNKIFSVSVDSHGRLAYAGRFGEKQKINGVEQLLENCPPEIIRGIKRAVVEGA
jgi:hypothetical protein